MATIDDLYQIRWNAIKSTIPYAPDSGIAQFWRGHPELGSPLSDEMPLDDGGVAQVFANGIVSWTPDGGAAMVQ